MSSLAYEEHYTKEDYYIWEGDWELIYGSPYAMSPSLLFEHQFTNTKISRQLDEQLDDCKDCYALSEMDVEFGDDTVVRPDNMVLCYRPKDKITKAPELIFEIISKSSAKRDEQLKFELYQSEGVKYYIIVYPSIQKAKVYKLKEGRYIKQGDFSDEKYSFELSKCDIYFDFDFIWER